MEARRAMRDAMAGGRPVTSRMLVDEANAIRLTGDLDGALLAIEDCIDENERRRAPPTTSAAWSWARWAVAATPSTPTRGRCELMPDNAVYIANAGHRVPAGRRRRLRGQHRAACAWPSTRIPPSPTRTSGSAPPTGRTGDEARAQVEYRRALELLRKEVEARPFDRDAWSRMWTRPPFAGRLSARRRGAQRAEAASTATRCTRATARTSSRGPVRKPVAAGAE